MPIGFTYGYSVTQKQIDSMDFSLLCDHLTLLGPAEMAEICGINLTTCKRYLAKNEAPIPIRRLLSFYRRGLPPGYGFESMYINSDGQLVNHMGYKLSVADINSFRFIKRQLKEYQEQIALLKNEVERLKSTYSISANDMAFF